MIVSIAILVSCIDSSISKKIWRLYVVYDKRPWVIVPAIILVLAYTGATHSGVNDGHAVNKLSFTAVGCVAFQFIVKARLGTDIFHVATSWITAFFALTMSTNVLCSGNEFPCGGAFFPRSDGLSNRRDCVANLQRGKAYGSRDYEDALASYFHHRREQRIICSWHHRGARVLPDRVKRAVPHRRRDRPTCRKPTLRTLALLLMQDFSQGIVFSLIVLQIRFHVNPPVSHRSGEGQMSSGGTWHRQPGPGQRASLNDPEYPMRSIRMAVHVSRQTHTHLSTQDASRASSSDDGIEKSIAL